MAGYRQLEKAYKEGKLKAIGISNFNFEQIQMILDNCGVIPALIQVERHPFYPQTEIRSFIAPHDMAIQAWYPLGGKGNEFIKENVIIKEIAVKHGKTPTQIILRWHIQTGGIATPGSKNATHIKENIDIFDFELLAEDLEKIAALDTGKPIFEFNPGIMDILLSMPCDVAARNKNGVINEKDK